MPSERESKSKSRTVHKHARPKFQSVVRVRPPLKKQNEDHVVLEALSDGTAVALHPSVKELMSPHSVSTVQTGQDVEFPCDMALPSNISQEKVYFKVGRPIALAAMESLKREKKKKTTHLILAMGPAQSGKSFTCMGNASSLSKRKSETDGLIPRMVDSLFFQSLHSSTCNQSNVTFVVEVSVLQVNQSKSNPSECKIIDLMQPVPSRSPRSSNPVGAIGSIATTILGGTKNAQPAQKTRYAELNEPVKVKQDPKSSECILTNATVKQCSSIEDTRLSLQKALARSRQVTSKKYQCHILFQLQPVLISKRSGRFVLEGEPIAVLDMASWEKRSSKSRSRDAFLNHDDAHTAVMHCLKAMQHNKEILSADEPSKSKLRQIPFLQHQATMLLQPLFSSKHTNKTSVTLLLNVSPGAKDYSEKKRLLSEMVQLHRPELTLDASTGISKQPNRKRVQTEDSSGSDKSSNSKPLQVSARISKWESKSSCKDDSLTYSIASHEKIMASPISPTLPPALPPKFEASNCGHSQAKQRPSAPFEDETSVVLALPTDNLEISPKSTSTAGSSSSSGCDVESPHGETFDFEKGDQSAAKFSYIDTLNKVVHASKKTGRKVLERMAVATSEADYQQRIEQLELENQELKETVKLLEEKNLKLVNENEELREKQQPEVSTSPAKSTTSSTSHLDAFFNTITPSLHLRAVSADEDYKEAEPESTAEEFSPSCRNDHLDSWKPSCPSIFDNPLMQQMTLQMGRGLDKPTEHNHLGLSAGNRKHVDGIQSSNGRLNHNHHVLHTEEQEESPCRPHAPYDNELFQHMAMINNL